ncbi:hypothetical protein MJ_1489.1 [Methanocaldococcus jannaschii DSM 2661]|uniref:Uncharacterized protein MJ1489.1 n=1 Tax=Methanocaldococcus jannaschii (strain ATCC 43067 / DSM 2661 / JAL-1 / JCM 10045 / NBRC 100440) TaxID=243232 RepID=YE8A_METJA|nr:RecName: Full=Uncharacterized protein MJ1489.1 [Methanocaldococcus jannaschii DSM 2661]AAB99513.1 hypothetical protein MJ_1489.1 [Methanocaldococcus jannaschii DSM 2661]
MLIAIGIMFQPLQYPTIPCIIFMVIVGLGLLFAFQFILGYGFEMHRQITIKDRIAFRNYVVGKIFNVLVEHSYYGLLLSTFNLFVYKKAITIRLCFIFAISIVIFWILGGKLIKKSLKLCFSWFYFFINPSISHKCNSK